MVLNLDEDTAMAVVGKFTGDAYDTLSSDVIDGVGELTNIIAGDAKNRLRTKGYLLRHQPAAHRRRAQLHHRDAPRASPCVVIKFSSGLGGFSLEVSLRKER